VDYIVFDPLEASLDIMNDSLTTLQSIITSNIYDVKTGPKLFYNKNGPNKGGFGDEIYIDCQPVGETEETVDIMTTTGTGSSPSDWLNNPMIQILLGSLLFIIIIYCIKYGLNMLKPSQNGGGTSFQLMQ
jgi:hypothetical protein